MTGRLILISDGHMQMPTVSNQQYLKCNIY